MEVETLVTVIVIFDAPEHTTGTSKAEVVPIRWNILKCYYIRVIASTQMVNKRWV